MPDSVESFITRWQSSGAAERANYALFLTELCDLLEVPRPDPASPDPEKNRYVFERAVTRKQPDGISTTGFIDLYKAGSFVLETKQGANDPAELGPLVAELMEKARPNADMSGRDAAR